MAQILNQGVWGALSIALIEKGWRSVPERVSLGFFFRTPWVLRLLSFHGGLDRTSGRHGADTFPSQLPHTLVLIEPFAFRALGHVP